MHFIIFSIIIALEVLVAASLLSNAFPIPHNPFWDTLLTAHYIYGLHPQRNLLLYAVFLGTCFLTFGFLLFFLSKRFSEPQFKKKFLSLTWTQAAFVSFDIMRRVQDMLR